MTGQSVVLSGNRFSALPTGVHLAGDTGSGSVDTLLSGNRFCDVATVLKKDSNVSGTVSVGQLGCEPDSPTTEPIEFSPGAAAAGETVTISGPDLHLSRQVLFHGTPAEFSLQTNNLGGVTLEAVVPARARDGAITVVRDTSASASTSPFTRRLTVSVTRTDGEPLALTCTPGAEDFSLESSADPAQGWQELQASPSQANGLYRLLPDSSPGAGFFRLRRN